MSLSYNNNIEASDFISLKDRVVNEIKRRAKTSIGGSLGNDYNLGPFTAIPNFSNISSNDEVPADYTNLLLSFFNNFVDFPPEALNEIYQDGNVIANQDIIYHLDPLLNLMSNLEAEPRNNDDCKANCRGLCQLGCNNKCTGCTGGCSSTCSTGCQGTCKSTCQGNCGGNCSGSCWDGCQGTCKSTCSGGCSGSCSVTCGKGCYSGGMHAD